MTLIILICCAIVLVVAYCILYIIGYIGRYNSEKKHEIFCSLKSGDKIIGIVDGEKVECRVIYNGMLHYKVKYSSGIAIIDYNKFIKKI